MSRQRKARPGPREFEASLAALSADELRTFVRDLRSTLDAGPRAQLEDTLLEHAVRGASGWRPSAPVKALIAEVKGFVDAACRVGHARPGEVDEYLRQGVKAFLAGDFATARAILGTMLLALPDGDIDLGQDEMFEEVLTQSIHSCAARYVVAVYVTTPLEERANAVFEALQAVGSLSYMREPLADMERVATGPLPQLPEFLPRWVARLKREPASASRWETHRDRWLREAIARSR